MFRLSTDNTFLWECSFSWPDDDGKPSERSFLTRFKRLSIDEFEDSRRAIAKEAEKITGDTHRLMHDFLTRVMVGVSDIEIVDADGKPVEMSSRETVDFVLGIPNIMPMLYRSYADALNGRLREKN